ncbi:MAG TPA: PspC domain-containing protein [Flavisolibacter sp.]|nr:PspC domain-containing protein [Flavisolibacter sp.]
MKKIININLSGRVIPIEDSAYESLQRYIDSLRRYFAKEEGRDEIINDIESRIAELMSDKIKKGTTAITDADIEEIINSMGRIEDFEEVGSASSTAADQNTSSNNNQASAAGAKRVKGRLYRDGTDKLLGGVCSGIANYMNVDPAIVRLLFAIVTFGGFGFGFLIYIILWIVLPVRNLDSYVGKRLFRNPDDKVISGVAGGLAAYFNKSSGLIRIIFAAPLLLNIIFGIFNGFFFAFHRDIFPNLFIGSFTGTFVLTYIILWIVLPEANSSFEKMEMRGEKVDVNRIRQNVKDEMENFKTKAQAWSEEVKVSAQEFGNKAKEFANTRGKTFAQEMSETTRPVVRGVGHIIGILFKAFFIFIAGCIALSVFAVLMVLIFGGVAWWPVNDFLWSSPFQKLLGWGTLILFITVPVIGFLVWLVRRIVRVRSKSSYLGWTFGGLWLIGLLCAITFGISIAKDLTAYDRTTTDFSIAQPANGKLIVKVNEPEIHYSGNTWWFHDDSNSWDIVGDTLKYSNVKIRVKKSDDSLYHVRLYKYSAGRNTVDAQNRAERTRFSVSSSDSILNIGSGVSVDKNSKFRGQGVIMEIQVPAGKEVRFDESIRYAFNANVIRLFDRDRYGHYWGQRYNYRNEWDNDEYFDWDTNVDYIMTTDGKLLRSTETVRSKKGVFELKSNEDSLQRQIEEREKQIEKDRQKLQEIQDKKENQSSTGIEYKSSDVATQITMPFIPIII